MMLTILGSSRSCLRLAEGGEGRMDKLRVIRGVQVESSFAITPLILKVEILRCSTSLGWTSVKYHLVLVPVRNLLGE